MTLFSAGGSQAEKFEVILSARDQGLTSGLRKASSQLDETAERVKRLGEAYLIFEGLRKGIDLVKEFNAAAVGSQVQTAQIKSALGAQGEAWRGVGTHVETTLSKLGKARGFLSGEMTDAFIKLETATGNSTKALQLLGVAQDLARGHNQSLSTTSLLVAKAAEGNSSALSRYGITLPKVTTAQDAFTRKLAEGSAEHKKYDAAAKNAIQAQKDYDKELDKTATGVAAISRLQKLGNGAAVSYANTTAGHYAQVRAEVEDLQTSLGKAILPGENKILGTIDDWVTALDNSKRVRDDFQQGLTSLGHGFGDLVSIAKTVGPPLVEIADDVKAIVDAVGGVGPIIAFGAAWFATGKLVGTAASNIERIAALSQKGALLRDAAAAGGIRPGLLNLPTPVRVAQAGEREGVAAIGADVAGSGALGGISRDARTAEGEVKAVGTEIGRLPAIADAAKPGIGTLGLALVDAFNPITLGIGSVALLAGGLYLLSQQEDAVSTASDKLANSLGKAGKASDAFNSASKDLASDKRGERDARTTLAGAKLQVPIAEKQLATAAPDLKAQARVNLQAAKNQVKDDAAALYSYEVAVSRDNAKKLAAEQAHLAATSRAGAQAVNIYGAAQQGANPNLRPGSEVIPGQSNAVTFSKPGGQALYAAATGTLAGANAMKVLKENSAEAAKAIDQTTAALDKITTANAKSHPALAATASALAAYIKQTKTVPTKPEAQFVFEHAKADTDVKTVAAQIKAFDNKKVNTELGIKGKDTVIGDILSVHNAFETYLPKTWNVTVNFKQGTTVKAPKGGHPGTNQGATGMRVTGPYGADDVPIWVTGQESVLNPYQTNLIDNHGYTVRGALEATGAPTVSRAGGFGTGGIPHTGGYSAIDNAPTSSKKKTSGATKGTGASHTGATNSTAVKPEDAFSNNQTSFNNRISGLLAKYAQDQLHTTKLKPLDRDLTQLLAAYRSRVKDLGTLKTSKQFRGSRAALAAINSEVASDSGTIGGYTSDLSTVRNPGAAPEAGRFTKSYAALQQAFDGDAAKAAIPVPKLSAKPTKKEVANRNAILNAVASGKKAVPRDRQKLIARLKQRISALKAMRGKREYRPYLGAIIAELDQDQTTLQSLYGDVASDQATDAQNATDAATAAAASTFNDTAFQQQVDAIQASIAQDQAALPPGVNVSDALQGDTQNLFDLVSTRTGDLKGLLASGKLPNAASIDDANNELTSDFGILAGITQGNTGAGGSKRAADDVTADQQAQIDQLTAQLATQTRATGLSNATVRAFGSSGDIGSGGYANADTSAQGSGPTIVINTLHPGDPATLAAVADAANAGNSLQQSIPNGRTTVNL